MLDAPQLTQLSQGDIRRDLNSDTVDQFSLDIFRGDATQRLMFLDPARRKPFRDSLNPIFDWLNQIKKQPHTEIDLSNASRCSPTEGEAPPPAWKPPTGNYMVFFERQHGSSGGIEYHPSSVEFKRSCVVVYGNGKFRAEKNAGKPLNIFAQVLEGQLDAAQLSDLRALLDDPLLVAMKVHHNLGTGGAYQDLETTRLAVPRPSSVQVLTFFSGVGRPGGRAGQMGSGFEAYHAEDPDRHVMDPLQKWIKLNIENQKFASVSDDKATECLPSN